MDFFLGFILSIITVIVFNRLLLKRVQEDQRIRIRNSQSYSYLMIGELLFGGEKAKRVQSQLDKYHEEIYVKIVIVENKAYWIKDNHFFVADVIDGIVDGETTKEVDTMTMDNVELNKILLVVETLREEEGNDYRNSREP